MRKKMYWGIASLILIIGVVGIFVMLQPEPVPEKRYIVPSEADLKKAREARKPPPGASPNGHWHDGEWHDESHAEPIAGVSQEMPTENLKTAEKSDLSKYDGKPIDEDFYRDNFSREELESMIKISQREIEQLRTKYIPRYERLLEKKRKFLESLPESLQEHTKKGIAEVEKEIRFNKFQLSNIERTLPIKLKVLNEEGNNVEK